MSIVILGNGFDLRHGLKTAYNDFLEYYLKNQNTNNAIFQYLIKINTTNGWVDFEIQLQNFLIHLSKLSNCVTVRERDQSIVIDYMRFVTSYEEHSFYHIMKQQRYSFWGHDGINGSIKIVNETWIKELEHLIEIDINEVVASLNTYLLKINDDSYSTLNLLATNEMKIIEACDFVISFNYTNFIEKYVKSSKVSYAHGNIYDTANGIILGIPYSNKITINKFHKWFKTNQSIDKQKNLTIPIRSGNSLTDVFFIGFSFGKSDHYFFQEFKNYYNQHKDFRLTKIRYNFFYHNQESKDQFISNLREFIGDENLITLYKSHRLVFIEYK